MKNVGGSAMTSASVYVAIYQTRKATGGATKRFTYIVEYEHAKVVVSRFAINIQHKYNMANICICN